MRSECQPLFCLKMECRWASQSIRFFVRKSTHRTRMNMRLCHGPDTHACLIASQCAAAGHSSS
eukprot:jgi/Bigna1/62078/fgenesh1_kg.30_\